MVSGGATSRRSGAKTNEVRIIWSLLIECLKCTINILNAHVEFSSKIMLMIMANQNASASSIPSSSQSPLMMNSRYKQFQSQSSWQTNRPLNQQPIQAPNQSHISFYQQQQQQQPRMPFSSKFDTGQQSRDAQLIGMGPNWRRAGPSFRNNNTHSPNSYQGRNTPDSGFSSFTSKSYQSNSSGGPQYRHFGNAESGFDSSELNYMSSPVGIPFSSNGVSLFKFESDSFILN